MTRKVALGGMLVAMAVVVTHLLATIPNVELTSFTLFMAGWLLGPQLGVATAVTSTVAFSLLNPMGGPGVLLLAGQLLGYASWGLVGGLLATRSDRLGPTTLAGLGALGTLWYQLLVNTALWIPSGLPLLAVFGPALPFVLPHLACNLVVFPALFPLLAPRLEPYRSRLEG